MSVISRIFLVLNLILAGCFVGFAGTYLQKADNFKTLYDSEVKKGAEESDRLTKALKAQTDRANNLVRENGLLSSARKTLEKDIDEAKADNAALQKTLGAIQASTRSTSSFLEKVSAEVKAARTDSKAAMDRAIAADDAKDTAESKMNTALASLADANANIKKLNEQITDQAANLAAREQKIREKDVLLALVTERYPSIFETLHPLVTGSVSRVGASGNLVTIALESGADQLKPGARFAIFSPTEGYKGEATVREIDSKKAFAFARISLSKGKKINKGDSASTNLQASGN